MCWICLPTCGGCKPPRKRMVLCERCGEFTLCDLQVTVSPEPRACMSCGFDITAGTVPEPKLCTRYGVECANPCALSLRERADCEHGACRFWTKVPR